MTRTKGTEGEIPTPSRKGLGDRRPKWKNLITRRDFARIERRWAVGGLRGSWDRITVQHSQRERRQPDHVSATCRRRRR
jgi:hypothetical protein